MSIRYKLLVGFSVALVVIAIQVITVSFFVRQLQSASEMLADLAAAQKEQLASQEVISQMRSRLEKIPDMPDPQKGMQSLEQDWQKVSKNANSLQNLTSSLGTDSKGLQQVNESYKKASSSLDNFRTALAKKGSDQSAFFQQMIFFDESLQGVKTALQGVGSEIEKSLSSAMETEKRVHNRPFQAGIAIGGLAAILLTVFAWLFSQRLVAPIKRMAEAARSIASGDIDQKIEHNSNDEVGVLAQSFQEMTHSLQGVIDETGVLIQAAQSGKLNQRGEVSKFQGAYADLIRGMNNTLDAVVAPINEAAEVLERVANQDLGARVKGDYEGDFARIKDALNLAVSRLDDAMRSVNVTVGQLNDTLSEVADSAEQVSGASSRITEISNAVTQGSSSQAASIEEVLSSLQEMASTSKQNALNAKEARDLTEKARHSADDVEQGMRRLSEAVNKIKESSDATARIVKTIDEIAFQTNLLALNAAVEAARAGEAGKGFAVVAEEVRNLAMRSAEAASDTANLIQESVSNAESGVAINEDVLKSLQEIIAQVNRVNEVMASEISIASEQQSQGIEQINSAVEHINGVTQETAVRSEEMTGAAKALLKESENMRELVARFANRDLESASLSGDGQEATSGLYSAQQTQSGRASHDPVPLGG